MSGLSPSLIWLCAAIAALPASPCRLIGGICDVQEQASANQGNSCCAEHSASHGEAPVNFPEDPCSRQCCKMGPAIPVIHDSAVDARLALSPVAFCLVPADGAEDFAMFSEPLLPGRSFRILHCRWRC